MAAHARLVRRFGVPRWLPAKARPLAAQPRAPASAERGGAARPGVSKSQRSGAAAAGLLGEVVLAAPGGLAQTRLRGRRARPRPPSARPSGAHRPSRRSTACCLRRGRPPRPRRWRRCAAASADRAAGWRAARASPRARRPCGRRPFRPAAVVAALARAAGGEAAGGAAHRPRPPRALPPVRASSHADRRVPIDNDRRCPAAAAGASPRDAPPGSA